jgi:hypothetical protein
MLRAERRGFFSTGYSIVREDGAAVGSIDWAWFKEAANVVVEGRSYRFYRQGNFQSTFTLEHADKTLAKARSAGLCSRAFQINSNGDSWQLKADSCWGFAFGVYREDVQIGGICPAGWTSRTFSVDLPPEVPLPVQVFLLWLVLVLKRRADQSASG